MSTPNCGRERGGQESGKRGRRGARIKEMGRGGEKTQEGAELKYRRRERGIKPGGANAITAQGGGWGTVPPTVATISSYQVRRGACV